MASETRTWRQWLAASPFLVPSKIEQNTIPLDQAGFTEALAKLLREALPTWTVDVPEPLTLVCSVADRPASRLTLDTIYKACRRKLEARDDLARRHVEAIAGICQDGLARQHRVPLRAILRTTGYVAALHETFIDEDALIAERFVGDLWVICAVDLPRAMRTATSNDLARHGLSRDQAIEMAIRNTAAELRPIDEASREWTRRKTWLVAGNPFESSRLLMAEDWAALGARSGGKLLAAAPSTDSVIYAVDGDDSIEILRRDIAALTQLAPRSLSPTIFRWSPGGWQAID